jgi:protoheme IX farnesyltransferase
MTSRSPRTGLAFRILVWSAVVCTYALIVFGGVVRITGSGMGCGDHWPLCNGHVIPPLDLPTMIEWGHRLAAALVSALTFTVAGVALWRYRADKAVLRPAVVAVPLLVVQVLLGAVTVKLELPAWSVVLHLANAMLILAAFHLTALRAGMPAGPEAPGQPSPLLPLARVTAGFGFAVVLLGALVANLDAAPACSGFPLCNGSWLPNPSTAVPVVVHWAHRMAAYAFVAFAVYAALRASRAGGRPATAGWTVLGLAAVQVAVAAGMILHYLPAGLRALHLAVGTAVWVALVWLVASSAGPRHAGSALQPHADPARPAPAPPRPTRALPASGLFPRARRVAADLVTLTKPRIISLLLVTTILPMFVARETPPAFALVLWTALGGYLMAGGANTINMWFDRDIDNVMGRTSRRPIPSGRISAGAALAFGVGLGAAAFAIFWLLVNPLAALLALAGLLFYVFVYTMWLKRSTPLNIVLGGAAGAFPPLVGWAAATGTVDLAAVYLFAIIFYWTPPHFWALALIKRADYARAGVPMLPVVRGERETKWQMLLYAIILVPLTLAPSVFGTFGALYAAAALLLGLRLVWYCIALLRAETIEPTAWRLYRFSLLYLALLFLAMAVDRVVPSGRLDVAADAEEVALEDLTRAPAR